MHPPRHLLCAKGSLAAPIEKLNKRVAIKIEQIDHGVTIG